MATNPRLEKLKARPKPPPAESATEPPPTPQKPLDQKRISAIFGSTMEPVSGNPVAQVFAHKVRKAPKPKPAPKPILTFACGHKEGIDHVEHRPCLGCLGKARRERNARRHEARAAKQFGGTPADFRFPAGTEGVASWTGESWRLRLNVPGLAGPLAVEATGIEAAWRAAKAAYLGAANGEATS